MNITEYIYSTDENARQDFEEYLTNHIWYEFVSHLPTEPSDQRNVWYNENGDEILCRTEEIAEMIADILDGITGEKTMHTGYYDPEDEQSPETEEGLQVGHEEILHYEKKI